MSEFILGDCLEYMRKMPDKCFDLAIVDPPYGINADRIRNGAGARDHAAGSTGFEIDEVYYEMAVERIKEYTAQIRMNL